MCKRMKPTTTVNDPLDERVLKRRHRHQSQEDDDYYNEAAPLINGLPDHISHLILSRLPPHLLFSISSSWRRFIYSPIYPAFPSLYALLSPNSPSTTATTTIKFAAYDFISSKWSPLPPSPSASLRLLLRHPSYISRDFPVQSLSVSGRLVLVAATITPPPPLADNTTTTTDQTLPLPHPLVFDPISQHWSAGPPLPAPRRWCAAGTVSGSVYVGSGIGSRFNSDVARTFEKWEVLPSSSSSSSSSSTRWEKLGQLKDGRLSREAIEAVGCKGKLYMVNEAAKEGVVYDCRSGKWGDMPEKMIQGWRGRAVAAMDEKVIYAVDERRGVLRRYDLGVEEWVDVVMDHKLCGAQQMAASKGKVYVVGKEGIVVVAVDDVDDEKKMKDKVWSLETPPGYNAVAVHVLPRMMIGR